MIFRSTWISAVLLFAAAGLAWGAEEKSWTDKIKLNGDFRYRHELISEETKSGDQVLRIPDRNRHRIRLRLGLQAAVDPTLDVFARLASGTGDPISTNQDMTGGSTPKQIWIDRAYADFHPHKWLSARGGKFGVPFESTDLVWDGDLNFEGIGILTSKTISKTDLYARGGGFWMAERSAGTKPDQGMTGLQGGIKHSFSKSAAELAIAYYDWIHIKDAPTLYNEKKGFGNSVYAVDDLTYYRNDFGVLDVNLRLSSEVPRVKGMIIGNYIVNTAAEDDADGDKNNIGWLAGFAFEFKKLPLDWELAYNYRDLQSDATVAAFTDSDPVSGGTNFSGHKISAGIKAMPKTKLGFTLFMDQRDPDGADLAYQRLMVDFETKF